MDDIIVKGKAMRSLQFATSAFTVSVFFSIAGFGQCQEVRIPKPEQSQDAVILVEYLSRAAIKLDCYFTIEEMPMDVDNWIQSYPMQVGSEPSSIEKMVRDLSGQLKGVHVYRSKENPAVVHIVDKRLEKEKDYPLPKCVAVKFRGSPQKLVEKLQSTFKNLRPRTEIEIGGFGRGDDDITKIHCSTPGASVRRVLTDWLPLSQYCRVLWIAQTRQMDGKWETDVDHLGKNGEGKIDVSQLKEDERRDDIDFESGAPKVNGVIPFDYGEIAYRNNPDPDKEKVRVNLVNQAVTFIDERLKADKPLQVRWAMFYLGKRKAKEGVPVLLKYLDYRYTTCGILEESYPAVRALTQIGKPAGDAAFDELVGKDQTDLRVRLLTAVVRAVDGPKPARDRLEKALAGADGGAQKKRLELALKWLEEEKD
jgi:hypothetical protein